MGTLIIEIRQDNTAEKLSANLEYHIPFDNSYNAAQFLEKVLDIKALASTWEGIKDPSKEYIADYKDITECMKESGVESNIVDIKRKIYDNQVTYYFPDNTYITQEIPNPISNDMRELTEVIKSQILNADSKIY